MLAVTVVLRAFAEREGSRVSACGHGLTQWANLRDLLRNRSNLLADPLAGRTYEASVRGLHAAHGIVVPIVRID